MGDTQVFAGIKDFTSKKNNLILISRWKSYRDNTSILDKLLIQATKITGT
jgi:hypothetical protein